MLISPDKQTLPTPPETETRRTRSAAVTMAAVAVLLLVGTVGCSSGDGPAPAGASTIEAGGVRWHAIVRGPAAAKAKLTVLFLHGAAYTSKIWADRGILDDVAQKGYRAVAVDLPGSGDTPSADKPKADLLAALVAKIGPAAKVVVVSPSASGAYSLALLQDRPEVELAGFVGVAPAGIESFRRPGNAPRIPALLIWGANDDVIPFANAKTLSAQLPGSRIERIANASHAAYDDRPDTFVNVLLPFLSRAGPGAS